LVDFKEIPAAKLLDVASSYETPIYVYEEAKILRQCQKVIHAFPDLPVKWLYAIKANDNPHIIELISKQGIGFDTVSYEEVLLCKHFAKDPADIFFTENSMTDLEMEKSIQDGVTLNIGALSRLERYLAHPDTNECCVRINPAIGDGHHAKVNTGDPESKFGIRIGLIDEAVKLAAKYNKKITGIHAHIGSGIKEPESQIAAMKVMLELSKEFGDLKFINFGGGMPTPYRKADKEFDMEEFAQLARPLLQEDLKERPEGFSYFFEPGRWFVAEAGFLLTTVHTVKNQVETVYLGTDTGMHHLVRPALYDAWHAVVNLSRMDAPYDQLYTIAGNICESGDILAFDRLLPESKTGDILAICDAGAYGMTMASQYNRRSLPAEVLIQEDGTQKCIRPPKNAEQTVQEFMEACGFGK
jgi:diaminopimelate decarboxylase